MGPVERQADAKATPGNVWSACFADFQWEKWDPDLADGCTLSATAPSIRRRAGMHVSRA